MSVEPRGQPVSGLAAATVPNFNSTALKSNDPCCIFSGKSNAQKWANFSELKVAICSFLALLHIIENENTFPFPDGNECVWHAVLSFLLLPYNNIFESRA